MSATSVTLADEKDQYGLPVARITYSWGENDKRLIAHALKEMQESLEGAGVTHLFRQEDDTNHLAGTARMGFDAKTSVVNADCRSWDIPNLWICDGSVFPTTGGVNLPSPSRRLRFARRTASKRSPVEESWHELVRPSLASVDYECVLEYAAQTGESPVWSIAEQALYWIDIQQPALHRFDPATGQDRHWMLPDEIGCFALSANGTRAILGLRGGLYELGLGGGELRELAQAPFDSTLFRFNEGGCDRTGRFWLGVMFDPKDPLKKSAKLRGEWHSYTESRRSCAASRFCGDPERSCVGSKLSHHVHLSFGRRNHLCVRLRRHKRPLGRAAHFRDHSARDGHPRRLRNRREGGYWSAIHGGGRLRRFHADGTFDSDVYLPVSLPTMCAFGGANLDTLYVTSKSLGLTLKQRERTAARGKTLCVFAPEVRGIPTASFGAACGACA